MCICFPKDPMFRPKPTATLAVCKDLLTSCVQLFAWCSVFPTSSSETTHKSTVLWSGPTTDAHCSLNAFCHTWYTFIFFFFYDTPPFSLYMRETPKSPSHSMQKHNSALRITAVTIQKGCVSCDDIVVLEKRCQSTNADFTTNNFNPKLLIKSCMYISVRTTCLILHAEVCVFLSCTGRASRCTVMAHWGCMFFDVPVT